MNPTCKTCRWWATHSEHEVFGGCHRRAPFIAITVTTGGGDVDTFPRFPRTHKTDFCGDHEPKAEENPE